MHHSPQIDPIFKRGENGAGVLLIHGFTGTPDSMRPVANRLHEDGFTVLAPLLAGHGTTPENLAETNWQDWYHSAQNAYIELHEKCSKIFVTGLSLGALLTLKLAINYPQAISAISCLATPLHLKSWAANLLPIIWHSPIRSFYKFQKKFGADIKDPVAKENFWNYDRMPLSGIVSITELQKQIRESIDKVVSPLLLMHSRHDGTAPYESMNDVARQASSPITETITLENCFHVITLDYEKELVASKVSEFFCRFL